MAYLYYASITVSSALVAADQVSFPVLISGTYDGTGGEPDIRTTANGGHVQNTANGGVSGTYTVPADLVFSPNTDGSAPYDFEIQEYDATTGKIIAWVEIPALSSTIDTVFYMVYGDATVVASQENVNGTWNASFKGVWHLAEASGLLLDSTINGIDLTAFNGPTYGQAGQIGNCLLFDDALDQYLEATVAAETAHPVTLSCWVCPDTQTARLYAVSLRDLSDSDQFSLILYGDVFGDRIRAYASGATAAVTAATTTGFTANTWYHACAVFTNATSRAAYINAGSKGTDATDSGAITDLDRTWVSRPTTLQFSGRIDEVRISASVRDDDYITTEYNSTFAPETFYAMGAEEGGPPIPPPGILPDYELSLMRSHPQMSDCYLVVQQPERFTEAPYIAQQEWVDFDWFCRVNGDQTDEIAGSISVNNGGPAASLLDGMTVLIGSAYGEWDKGAVRLRTDQTVGPGTTTLYIATSSDVRGHVRNGDYIVVLDEFRLWQRFGRIESDAEGNITWIKDHDIEWEDLGGSDIARRLAMMPPVPVMGPHAVKFVDPPQDGAQFYFDWSDSYAMAVGAGITSWNSWGETDHAGGTWTYNVNATPGWQTVNFISGLRGYRVVLEVDDGNGNPTTLPYRRGVRYVFTLRRPGQSQAHDPANAEPITEFSVSGPVQGSFDSGYWKASITVYGEAASHYEFQPEALVILFTDDWYTSDDPYLDPRGLRNASIGPIYDRENILLVGRIDGSSLTIDSEAGTVSFDILSPGAEAAMYHDYPVAIQDATLATDWINTPSLNPDRALWYYLCWHSTLPNVADLYLPGDTHPLFARDFLEGTIYDISNDFLENCIMGRMLSDRYGRIHCEYIAQYRPYGSTATLWSLADGDWSGELHVNQAMRAKAKSADAGGIIYTPATGAIVPKLSRAPGQFDKYRGRASASNSLAINSQVELNIISGRYLEGLNYEYEIGIDLAGYWPYLDIAPQYAIYVVKETDRGTINARFLPQTVSFTPDHAAGCIFTSVETVQEMDDGVPGVTIPIPDEMPDLEPPENIGLPTEPAFPDGFAPPPLLGPVPGEPPSGNDGYWYLTRPWFDHYWQYVVGPNFSNENNWQVLITNTEAPKDMTKTCLMYSATTNRFFGYGGYGSDGVVIWEYTPLPMGTGSWTNKWTEAAIATELGHGADYDWIYIFRMEMSCKATQDGWGWAAGRIDWLDGDGDTHVSIFCLHTRNGWNTIAYATIIDDWEEDVDCYWTIYMTLEGALAVDMHSNTVYVVFAHEPEEDGWGNPLYDGWCKLYRSQDFGATFTLAVDDGPYEYGNPYYGCTFESHYCDCWAPWVSNTYAGGSVFWSSTFLQYENLGVEHQIVPMIYNSQNHGLSYENIGDDGGLDDGLNVIGGPYNSSHRLYGARSMWRGRDAEQHKAYQWRRGYGWTLIRESTRDDDFWSSYVWVVMRQDGYELTRYIAYGIPYDVYPVAGADGSFGPAIPPPSGQDERFFWLTFIPG